MDRDQERLKKFRESGQEAVRLQLALEAYRDSEGLSPKAREAYRAYLRRRRRPAAEAVIRDGSLEQLQRLWVDGILTERDREDCLEKAWQAGQAEMAAWLLGPQKPEAALENPLSGDPSPDGTSAVPAGELHLGAASTESGGRAILRLIRSGLQLRLPAFALAFGALPASEEPRLDRCLGTDGQRLYFQPQLLEEQFQRSRQKLEQIYLHTSLHALYLHVVAERGRKPELWEAACDWTVEYRAAELLDGGAGSPKKAPGQAMPTHAQAGEGAVELRARWFRQLEETGLPVRAEAAYRWLEGHPEAAQELQALFRRDAHPWQWEPAAPALQISGGNSPGGDGGTAGGGEGSGTGCQEDQVADSPPAAAEWKERLLALGRMEETVRRWNRIQRQVSRPAGARQGRRGTQAGSGQEAAVLEKRRKVFDYRRFLKRYAVFREEMQLDMDSFDYLPYLYSREHYEKLLLLEPLEYAEVNRLEELVIAIDTSGSCSGPVVRRFLEETYQIFSETENFFRRMQVAVVQCDSMIQDCTIIHCREEWEAYVKELKIQGLGGTDFRPVFQLVEQMRDKGRLRNLKGLLYFTDGDGIYPSQKPPYETAFVFLNDAYQKQTVPDWAVTLNLRLRL